MPKSSEAHGMPTRGALESDRFPPGVEPGANLSRERGGIENGLNLVAREAQLNHNVEFPLVLRVRADE